MWVSEEESSLLPRLTAALSARDAKCPLLATTEMFVRSFVRSFGQEVIDGA